MLRDRLLNDPEFFSSDDEDEYREIQNNRYRRYSGEEADNEDNNNPINDNLEEFDIELLRRLQQQDHDNSRYQIN